MDRALTKAPTALFQQDSSGKLSLRIGAFQFCATGMEVEGDPTFDEWQSCGLALRAIDQDIISPFMFWVGDYINYGEHTYGDQYAQMMEDTGLAYQTLANAVYVCSRVEPSRRREHLSFSHHAEVASLSPHEQTTWLDRAADESWSSHELRAHIRKEVKGHATMLECPQCGAQFEVTRSTQVIKTIRPRRKSKE